MDDFLVSKWNTSTRGNQIVPAFCCRGATAATVLEYDTTNCTTSPTSTTAYINMVYIVLMIEHDFEYNLVGYILF